MKSGEYQDQDKLTWLVNDMTDDHKYKTQEILNKVFDETNLKLSTSGDTVADPSLVLTYDVDENLATITKTVDATEYRKTLVYNVDGNLTSISQWNEI